MKPWLWLLWLLTSRAVATNLTQLEPLETIQLQSIGANGVKDLSFDSSGQRMLTLSSIVGCGALASLWDVRTGQRMWQVCVPLEADQSASGLRFVNAQLVRLQSSLNTTEEIVPTFVTDLNARTGRVTAALRSEGQTLREVIAEQFGIRVRDIKAVTRLGQLLAYSQHSTSTIHVVQLGPGRSTNVARLREVMNDDTVLEFSPNGQQLAVGRFSGRISLWDIRTGTKRFNLRGHSFGVDRMIWSQNSRRLISQERQTVIAWDVKTGMEISRYSTVNPLEIQSLALQGSNETVALGTTQATVILMRTSSGRIAGRIGFTVSRQLYSADGQLLCLIAQDNRARFYRRVGNRFRFDHETLLPGMITGKALVHDGQLIVPVFGVDKPPHVIVYHIASRRLERIETPQNGNETRVIAMPERHLYWVGTYLLNAQTAAVNELRFENANFGNPRPDLGRLLYLGGNADTLTLSSVAEENPVVYWTRPWVNIEPGANTRLPEWSPSGALLVAPWLEGKIIVLDAKTGKTKALIALPIGGVADESRYIENLSVSPDDQLLVVRHRAFDYFDLKTRKALPVPNELRNPLEVQFTPDGRTLITTTLEGLQFWGVPGKNVFGK